MFRCDQQRRVIQSRAGRSRQRRPIVQRCAFACSRCPRDCAIMGAWMLHTHACNAFGRGGVVARARAGRWPNHNATAYTLHASCCATEDVAGSGRFRHQTYARYSGRTQYRTFTRLRVPPIVINQNDSRPCIHGYSTGLSARSPHIIHRDRGVCHGEKHSGKPFGSCVVVSVVATRCTLVATNCCPSGYWRGGPTFRQWCVQLPRGSPRTNMAGSFLA
jgi:hypothetical protein